MNKNIKQMLKNSYEQGIKDKEKQVKESIKKLKLNVCGNDDFNEGYDKALYHLEEHLQTKVKKQ